MVKDISYFLSFSKFLIKISLKLTRKLGHIFLINKVFSSFIYLEIDIKVNIFKISSSKNLNFSKKSQQFTLNFAFNHFYLFIYLGN